MRCSPHTQNDVTQGTETRREWQLEGCVLGDSRFRLVSPAFGALLCCAQLAHTPLRSCSVVYSMPHSFGYRARTRDMFSRDFRKAGLHLKQEQWQRPLHVGDYVDIHVNSNVHKGMAHKGFQGRTGIVFNVTKRAVGVEINKIVRNRVVKKRIHVRVEHVEPSQCRKDFLKRVKRIETLKREAKAAGKEVPIDLIRRQPKQPKAGFTVKANAGGKTPVVQYPAVFSDIM